jgi:hypothetical protein
MQKGYERLMNFKALAMLAEYERSLAEEGGAGAPPSRPDSRQEAGPAGAQQEHVAEPPASRSPAPPPPTAGQSTAALAPKSSQRGARPSGLASYERIMNAKAAEMLADYEEGLAAEEKASRQ